MSVGKTLTIGTADSLDNALARLAEWTEAYLALAAFVMEHQKIIGRLDSLKTKLDATELALREVTRESGQGVENDLVWVGGDGQIHYKGVWPCR